MSLKRFMFGDFPPLVICTYLNIPFVDQDENEKKYVLDDVAKELLGHKCVWPKSNVLKVVDLTLKYNCLYKIALKNWLPTKHVTSVSRNFATVLFGIGTRAIVNLGQSFFDAIMTQIDLFTSDFWAS